MSSVGRRGEGRWCLRQRVGVGILVFGGLDSLIGMVDDDDDDDG